MNKFQRRTMVHVCNSRGNELSAICPMLTQKSRRQWHEPASAVSRYWKICSHGAPYVEESLMPRGVATCLSPDMSLYQPSSMAAMPVLQSVPSVRRHVSQAPLLPPPAPRPKKHYWDSVVFQVSIPIDERGDPTPLPMAG